MDDYRALTDVLTQQLKDKLLAYNKVARKILLILGSRSDSRSRQLYQELIDAYEMPED